MTDRRAGGALLSVVLILMVVGGITALIVQLAVVERRLARGWSRHAQATEVARTATLQVLPSWHAGLTMLPIGDSAAFGGADSHGTAWYAGWVHRLGGPYFLIRAIARTPDGSARASAGLLTRMIVPPLSADTSSCMPTWIPLAAPDVLEHMALLAPWADVVLPSGEYGPSALDGAGEALVVLARGNLQLKGGKGEGVLLVEGDLAVVGDFAFRGLVLVTGTVRQSGGPFEIRGALRGAGLVQLGYGARVLDDPCVLVEIAQRLARPVPLRSGRWLSVAD